MQPSPYTPASVAEVIAGRDPQLAHYTERLSYLADLHRLVPRIRVENGPRGMGKTSLLRHVQQMAESSGMATVWTTTNPGVGATLLDSVMEGLEAVSRDWSARTRERLAKIRDNFTISVSAAIPGIATFEASNRESKQGLDHPVEPGIQQFKAALVATVEAAEHEGRRGLVLFVDEIQDADDRSLRTIAHCWQEMQAESPTVPTALFAAGLPSSPGVIAAAVTHSERFDYRTLGPISDEAARVALAEPAGRLGVRWDLGALDVAVAYGRGNPFVLQVVGDEAWRGAGRPDSGGSITGDHVVRAVRSADASLSGLFRARWDRATSAEQRLMRAMAELGDGPLDRAAVVDRLGLSSSSAISIARGALIDKGLIEAPVYGQMQFTIPGFAGWIRRTTDAIVAADPTIAAARDRQQLLAQIAALQQQVNDLGGTSP